MAHPYKSAAHKNDPKWLGGVRKYADGGGVDQQDFNEVVADMRHQREYDSSADPTTNKGQGPTPQNLRNKQFNERLAKAQRKD